jgi:hypothetical protein
MNPQTAKQPAFRTCDLPTMEVTMRVKRFRNVLEPCPSGESPLTEFTMEGPDEEPAKDKLCLDDGDYQKRREANERGSKPPPSAGEEGIPKKKHTVHVPSPGAILRFEITGELENTDSYRPVGIAFERADGTGARAVEWSTGEHPLPLRPFSAFELNGHYLQITDIPRRRVLTSDRGWLASDECVTTGERKPDQPPWITYKFSIFIQQRSDGAIGIIDPYIENENVK